MKQKIAITLDQDLLRFLNSQAAQAGSNRSAYLSRLLCTYRDQLLKQQAIIALQEDASDPEYLAELAAWDNVAGDGVDAERRSLLLSLCY